MRQSPEHHAMRQLLERGQQFGNPLVLANRTVAMGKAVQAQNPTLTDYILVVAESEHKVYVGDSNGNQLLAIVRDNHVNTFLLRRSTQSKLSGLPYFKGE